jgi:hypothetical protein
MVLQGLNSPDCDMDFPPGFGPSCESSEVSLSSSSLGRTGKIGARSEPRTTLYSGPLSGAQMMLVNELYVASKQSLFHYFEEVIAEEITNCLCSGLGSSIDEVSCYTDNKEFILIITDIPKFTQLFFYCLLQEQIGTPIHAPESPIYTGMCAHKVHDPVEMALDEELQPIEMALDEELYPVEMTLDEELHPNEMAPLEELKRIEVAMATLTSPTETGIDETLRVAEKTADSMINSHGK